MEAGGVILVNKYANKESCTDDRFNINHIIEQHIDLWCRKKNTHTVSNTCGMMQLLRICRN